MPTKRTKQTTEEMVRCIDFPHLQDPKGKWLKASGAPKAETEFAFKRLCFYAEKLRDLGMSDTDIACMFSDLYCDAVAESDLNKKANA